MPTIEVAYSEDVLLALRERPEEFAREFRMAAAAKLFEQGRLSSGMAAALAGVPRVTFLLSLERYGVSPIQTEPGEIAEDVRNA